MWVDGILPLSFTACQSSQLEWACGWRWGGGREEADMCHWRWHVIVHTHTTHTHTLGERPTQKGNQWQTSPTWHESNVTWRSEEATLRTDRSSLHLHRDLYQSNPTPPRPRTKARNKYFLKMELNLAGREFRRNSIVWSWQGTTKDAVQCPWFLCDFEPSWIWTWQGKEAIKMLTISMWTYRHYVNCKMYSIYSVYSICNLYTCIYKLKFWKQIFKQFNQ